MEKNEKFENLKNEVLLKIKQIETQVKVKSIECSDLIETENTYFYSTEINVGYYLSQYFLDKLYKIKNVKFLFVTAKDNDLLLNIYISFNKSDYKEDEVEEVKVPSKEEIKLVVGLALIALEKKLGCKVELMKVEQIKGDSQ